MIGKTTGYNQIPLGVPEFGNVPEDKMAQIAKLATNRTVPANTVLVRQNEPGDSFYIIISGQVRVYRKSKATGEIELSILGPGESFGEMALLTDQPRSAYVETIEETNLTVLTKDQFNKVLHDYPDISIQFVKQLSTWLQKDELRLEEETKRRAPSLSLTDFAIIFIISLFCGIIFNQVNPNGIKLFPKSLPDRESYMIDAESIKNDYDTGSVLFIDARPTNFYDENHVKGAVNLPDALFDIMYVMLMQQIDDAEKVIVYGRTISSRYDEKVVEKLSLYGYKNIKILKNGLSAWQKKGYPTEP